MGCNAGFYLDIISSSLLNMHELCSKSKVDVSEDSKRERRHKIETKIIFIRIAIGITVSIVGFVLVAP